MSSTHIARVVAVAIVLFSSAVHANEEKAWSISKSSGEVWAITAGAQQASLSQGAGNDLKPGETIRTGRNGRVLLVRGQESILVAPNSSVTIPKDAGDLSTTIVQQAGSILLDVEKRNVKHFAVETPFLAAVVKGTQFRVSVTAVGTSVNVLQGQVEVADFRSGQIARVLPGQAATSSASGPGGLALTGSGVLSPIEQGKSRPPAVDRLIVPRNGLAPPRGAANAGQFRSIASQKAAGPKSSQANGTSPGAQGHQALRIRSPIGQVRLNVNHATNGMARSTTAHAQSGRSASQSTIWTTSPTATAASENAVAAAAAAPGASRANANSGSSGNSAGVGNGPGKQQRRCR